ncbi:MULTISPECIES: hypothetical protein [Sphingobacterium]|uniref:hypothetical protein n=1 Tax=Sphingobacterium TaxID=28453 RepID=UPI00257E399B|nr:MULTISPECIES: hypothetical protein [Sphingobacterium]
MTKLKLLDKNTSRSTAWMLFCFMIFKGIKVCEKKINKAGCGSLIQYADQINKYGKEWLKSPGFIYR